MVLNDIKVRNLCALCEVLLFLGENENLTFIGNNGTTDGGLVPIGNQSDPRYALLLLSGTVVLIFITGGIWMVLYCVRPDLLQAMALFISGGLAVSTEHDFVRRLYYLS